MERMRRKKPDLFVDFRFNLRLLRTYKQISAEELSLKLELNEYRIGNIENSIKHTPRLEEIILICKYFEVSESDMLRKKAKVLFT